ncbi:MAG TPA: hypothetical protein PLF13_10365 [candidate division Zixibacteria bacterium]|nr:hypothetical protein [candidate division Zixibacteria bacterium]
MRHLTDDEIQDYLDTGLNAIAVEQHLAECSDCREAVAAYRLIYTAAAEEPEIELSAQFTDRLVERAVIAAKPEIVPASSSSRSYAGVFWAAGVAVMLAVLYYFTNSFDVISQLGIEYWTKFSEWTALMPSWTALWEKIGIRPDLILVPIIILALFGVLDHALRTARRGKAMFLA